MENADGPIHIPAANRDDSPRDAAKNFHELPCLSPIAENEIDNGVRAERTKLPGMQRQIVSIANDLVNGNWRMGNPPMKHTDFMSEPGKLAQRLAADEPGCTNEKDSHSCD